MRILIGSDLYWPMINGIATFSRNLAHGLAEAGHEVVVVAPSPTGRAFEERDDNYTVARTLSIAAPIFQAQTWRFSVSPTREIKQIVKTFQPDIIHVQTPLGIGLGAVAVAKKFEVPLVATNHAMSENVIENLKLLSPIAKQVDFVLRHYGQRFYGNADFVTLPTEAAIKMMATPSFRKPYRAISNGIDLSRFSPGKANLAIREKFGVPADIPVIMYLGRVDQEKHISVAVKAVQRLAARPAFHMVVVGFGNDLERLKELAGELGVADRITFTGRIEEDDKLDLLRTASIFVMPSPAELQSIATLEAMAAGLPVVAVNAGALYELCQDGQNGLLFSLDSDAELADKLTRLLDDPKLALAMGKESLAIAHRHDLKTVIKEFEDLYAQVKRDYQPQPSRLAQARAKIQL